VAATPPGRRGDARLRQMRPQQPIILSIHVGRPRQYGGDNPADPADRAWTSGYVKAPVQGGTTVSFTNLAGDGQADLKHHGGPEKAVLAYSADHYPAWNAEFGRADLGPGALGENLAVVDQDEAAVCIGDTYRAGDVLLQVSQPRQPCWKISRVLGIPQFTLRVQQTGRTGWYLRVLREGHLHPGRPLELASRPFPRWTVAEANAVMHHRKADRQAAAELAAVALLSANWRHTLSRRATSGVDPDPAPRLLGV
jgi:MOSC domain-containing protein YiiM